MRETGNPLNAAIADENGFFVVERDGQQYLTRDGAFKLNGEGVLTLADGRSLVLSENGNPITLADLPGGAEPLPDGGIQSLESGEVVDRIALVQANDLTGLVKAGDNLYRDESSGTTAGGVTIRNGVVESSAVDSIREMVNMIEAARAYQTNMRFISMQDNTLGRTLQTVGRAGR